MAHDDGVAVQGVQLLDALEAVVDEIRLGCQGVPGIDAFLDAAAHVVVLECQAVGSLGRLDHAVLGVPDLRPAGGRVHGAVRHAAVLVIGEGKLCVVLGGRGILVQIVGCIGPRDARLGCRDTVADRVVGVGIGIGCIHIGHGPRQLRSIIIGVGDDVRCGVRASRAGHGRAPPDGIIGIAVGGYRPVLDLREEIAVRLV